MRLGCCGKAMLKACKRRSHTPHRSTRRMPHSSSFKFNDIRGGALWRYIEEQFHLPSAAIQFGDSEGRQIEIVGKKDEQLVVFDVVELHSPQVDRIVLAGMAASEPDGLIAAQAGCLVDGVRINAPVLQIGFGTRDEESLGLMQGIEPSEIDITAIHDIETAGFESQLIENIHIPQLAV